MAYTLEFFFQPRRSLKTGLAVLACLVLVLQGASALAAEDARTAFAKAMSTFDALSLDKVRGMQREPWEKLEAAFARIKAPQGAFAAEAFFYQARCREELADRSKRKADYEEAVKLYNAMARTYTKHNLADNALYNQAMILSGPLKAKDEAVKTLDRLIAQYPKGDMVKEALLLRERLKPAAPSGAAGSAGTGPARPPSAASATPETPNYGVLTAPGQASGQPAASSSAHPAPSSSAQAGAADAARQRKLYDDAAREWKQLTSGSHPRSGHRDVWEKLQSDFQAAMKAAPAGEFSDKAAFQAARCREELAQRSKSVADWKDAAWLFATVAKSYPQSSLADDALYARALILDEKLNARTEARQACQLILEQYPKGDMAEKARVLLRKLGGDPAPATAEASSAPTSSAATPPAQSTQPAQSSSGFSGVKNLKAPVSGAVLSGLTWSGDAKKFVLTIELAGKAKYQRDTLPPADGGSTARIQITLLNTRMDSRVKKLLEFDKLPVRAVQANHPDKQNSRVMLEVDGARSYKVSVLQNPYRIQVEVSAESMLAGGHDLAKTGGAQPGRATPSTPSGASGGSLVEQLGLTVKTIVVDAGHGGSDPGAIGNGITERTYTLELATLLGRRLRQKGFTVVYTRDSNKYVALQERTSFANERKADIFISIHVNSSTNKNLSGVETYYLDAARSNAASVVAARENAVDVNATSDLQFILSDLTRNSKRDESREVATLVLDRTMKQLQRGGFSVKNNGVRSAPFYVLMGARMPAFLIEVGYLSNTSDAKRLKDKKYMERLADGVVDGIVAYRDKINSMRR